MGLYILGCHQRDLNRIIHFNYFDYFLLILILIFIINIDIFINMIYCFKQIGI